MNAQQRQVIITILVGHTAATYSELARMEDEALLDRLREFNRS
ncbi:hypothetical protein [Sediminibacillus halophilus]|uniref:Uncharacterized protein n=1 Tax=Sediminibacillus halophilus TaxID=482461 RepID=A0A1G9QVW0_9BACI|nr:hypothetical protein [Sediminibacillus halophilus]SDM15172.1 hypothetical protein SAMN05216244_1694 [Sediminibacillus halophilus]